MTLLSVAVLLSPAAPRFQLIISQFRRRHCSEKEGHLRCRDYFWVVSTRGPAVVMSRASETLPPIFTPAAHTRRLGFS